MKIRYVGQGEARALVLTIAGVNFLIDCPVDLEDLLGLLPTASPCEPFANTSMNRYTGHGHGYGEQNSVHGSSSMKSGSAPISGLASGVTTNPHAKFQGGRGSDMDSRFVSIGARTFVDSSVHLTSSVCATIDFEDIDYILVSHADALLGLPFITERFGFKGQILATGPTIEFARYQMMEMVQLVERGQLSVDRLSEGYDDAVHDLCHGSDRSRPSNHHTLLRLAHAHGMYRRDEVLSCLRKITDIRYLQQVAIAPYLSLRAVSSGYMIGASNWHIRYGDRSLAVISASSSAVARHPGPLDYQSLLGVDVAVAHSMDTRSDPRPPDAILNAISTHIVSTLNRGGNVIIPIQPHGVVFDLIELAQGALTRNGTIYFISPYARESLAFANIQAEWLCKSRQDRAFIPEPPFAFERMVQHGVLKIVSSVGELAQNASIDPQGKNRGLHKAAGNPPVGSHTLPTFTEPAVIFCGHPSLRFGDAVHFIRKMGQDSKSSLLLTDPLYDYDLALAPFQPLQMATHHLPLDPRLTRTETVQFVHEIFRQPASRNGETATTAATTAGSGNGSSVYQSIDQARTAVIATPHAHHDAEYMQGLSQGHRASNANGVRRDAHDDNHVTFIPAAAADSLRPLRVKFTPKFVPALMSQELASSFEVSADDPSIQQYVHNGPVAPLTASVVLSSDGGDLQLQPLHTSASALGHGDSTVAAGASLAADNASILRLHGRPTLFGAVDAKDLVSTLLAASHSDVHISADTTAHRTFHVSVPSLDATVVVAPTETKVVTNNPTSRRYLTELVLSQLTAV